ncbi:hypothetical protein DL93DRAFT_2229094 [Clavulina sp. PMI_390]|nr:hypothetical protein DL93DRAFT_2229094 [Clavulina sp. PMI_390]
MSTSNLPNAAVEAPNALSSRQNPTANTPQIKPEPTAGRSASSSDYRFVASLAM